MTPAPTHSPSPSPTAVPSFSPSLSSSPTKDGAGQDDNGSLSAKELLRSDEASTNVHISVKFPVEWCEQGLFPCGDAYRCFSGFFFVIQERREGK